MLEHVGGGAIPYHNYFCVKMLVAVGRGEVVSAVILVLVILDTAYKGVVLLLMGMNYLELILHNFKIPIKSMFQALQAVVRSMQLVQWRYQR